MATSTEPITDDGERATYLRSMTNTLRSVGNTVSAILIESVAYDFGIELDKEDN